jgi:HSP20 family protein
MLPLTKWSPVRELGTLHREMDELFNRVFGRAERWLPEGLGEAFFSPAVDYSVKGDKLDVRVELPGVDPKDVDISLTGNMLTIKGERKTEKEVKEENYYMREIGMGRFERTLNLPEGVDTEKIKAAYKNGILHITMPAGAVKASRKIEIEAEPEAKKLKAA